MTTPPLPLLNRELGLIEFNRRVLSQAEDTGVPLLERLKFLCIVSSNLDEFFEVRVASLKEAQRLSPGQALPDGLLPSQALAKVSQAAHGLVERQYWLMREVLDPWSFVIAAYVIGVGGTAAMIAWSWIAMRRAEKRREKSRER